MQADKVNQEIEKTRNDVWVERTEEVEVWAITRHSTSSTQCFRCDCEHPYCTGWAYTDYRADKNDPDAYLYESKEQITWENQDGKILFVSPEEHIKKLEYQLPTKKYIPHSLRFLGQ